MAAADGAAGFGDICSTSRSAGDGGQVRRGSRRNATAASAALLAGGLTLFAVAVDGYHPYAEDGGLYLAGVKRLLDPALYPHGAEFMLEPMRLSLFAPAVAEMVRLSHLGLPAVLLMLHVASVWATLFGAWMLAGRCWSGAEAQAGAVALLACWLALAGGGNGAVSDGSVCDGAEFFHALHGAGAGGSAGLYGVGEMGGGGGRAACCCGLRASGGGGSDASADGGVCAGRDADAGVCAVVAA